MSKRSKALDRQSINLSNKWQKTQNTPPKEWTLIKKEGTDELGGNIPTIHEGEIARTRSGCIIKKPDRLTYI